MNIIDAIKSNKPFKRPNYIHFMSVSPTGIIVWEVPGLTLVKNPAIFSAQEILADDWFLKEPETFPLNVISMVGRKKKK